MICRLPRSFPARNTEPVLVLTNALRGHRGSITFGEDPLLTGAIGAAEITGIQSQGVLAQAKHYIVYDGANGDVIVESQTLHEIYLKPFQDAVDAGVSSIMCSYNKINGAVACGSKAALANGTVDIADVNAAVSRIRAQYKRFGLLDGASNTRSPRSRFSRTHVSSRTPPRSRRTP
ncbi:hypothetical protein FPZ12_044920 [Amycolatopsis acidicola]|uniref:Glycoside hydrolase family 3 N-terminal domain-containing protein n=1 Tax=Amycolatopsis acidicola TaxID=2596893 RepID=A0A5N0UKI7_9PSEU|nr:glycoside hydrolase family 3 N-terminal domain-containing protein [Amycolatopsis acidicola]KAA9148525.1 hypothetical protein FPZ12_044920 [Amycolatopsis acidicola]